MAGRKVNRGLGSIQGFFFAWFPQGSPHHLLTPGIMLRTFSIKAKQLQSYHLICFLKRCLRVNEEEENVCQMV